MKTTTFYFPKLLMKRKQMHRKRMWGNFDMESLFFKGWYTDKTALLFHNNQMMLFPHKTLRNMFSCQWYVSSLFVVFLILFSMPPQWCFIGKIPHRLLKNRRCLSMTKSTKCNPQDILPIFLCTKTSAHFSFFVNGKQSMEISLFHLWVMVWEPDFNFNSSCELTQCQ